MKTYPITAALILLAAAGPLHAQDVHQDLMATAQVSRSCTITHMDTLNFGEYDPVGAHTGSGNVIVPMSLHVKCAAKMTGVALSLGKGENPDKLFNCNSPRRYMKGPSDIKLRYLLFNQDINRFWGCTIDRVGDGMTETLPIFTSSLTPQTVNIVGVFPYEQDARIGTYTDSINVGVTF